MTEIKSIKARWKPSENNSTWFFICFSNFDLFVQFSSRKTKRFLVTSFLFWTNGKIRKTCPWFFIRNNSIETEQLVFGSYQLERKERTSTVPEKKVKFVLIEQLLRYNREHFVVVRVNWRQLIDHRSTNLSLCSTFSFLFRERRVLTTKKKAFSNQTRRPMKKRTVSNKVNTKQKLSTFRQISAQKETKRSFINALRIERENDKRYSSFFLHFFSRLNDRRTLIDSSKIQLTASRKIFTSFLAFLHRPKKS